MREVLTDFQVTKRIFTIAISRKIQKLNSATIPNELFVSLENKIHLHPTTKAQHYQQPNILALPGWECFTHFCIPSMKNSAQHVTDT